MYTLVSTKLVAVLKSLAVNKLQKNSHDHSSRGQEVRVTNQNLVIKHVILVKRERHFTSAQ